MVDFHILFLLKGSLQEPCVPVNKSLLTIFMAAKYAEQSGHGVPTIVDKYGRSAFSFADGMIKVTIPLEFEREEIINRVNKEKVKNNLTDNQKTCL